LNYDFSGVDAAKNDKDLYGLRYADFVVPLAKAVQELSQENDSLKKENEALDARLTKIETMLSQQSTSSSAQQQSQAVELGMNAFLKQNIPNPFGDNTIINYYLPGNATNASINFYNQNGSLLKSVKLNAEAGRGNINLKADELPSGVYRYSLIVDGKIIDTKQMLKTR